MRQNKTDTFIKQYCEKNGITLCIDSNISKNNGSCYTDIKEIHLSTKYSSAKHKLAIFLHEVAHIRVERFKALPYNVFECEYYSWFEAMKLHKKYFGKSFSKSQADLMLRCLKLYSKCHYGFRKNKIQ